MFDIFRDKQKPIMIAMLFLVGIPFVFLYGVDEQLNTNSGTVGQVFDEDVSTIELNAEMHMLSLFGGQKMDSKQLEKQAWSSVELYHMAKREGIVVSDAGIQKYIGKIPAFQEDGAFKSKFYEQWLRRTRLTSHVFEDGIRRMLTRQRFSEIMMGSVNVTAEDIKKDYKKSNETVDVSLVEFNSSDFVSKDPVGDAELKTFYKTNEESYRSQEEIKLRYLLAENEVYKQKVKVDEKSLLAHYENTKKRRYTLPAKPQKEGDDNKKPVEPQYKPFKDVQKRVKDDYVNTQSRELAKAAINEVVLALEQSKGKVEQRWEAVAKKHNVKFGRTDFFSRRELSQQAFGYAYVDFKQSTVKTSGVISAGKGAMIYRIEGRQAPRIKTFDEVHAEVKIHYGISVSKKNASKAANDFRAKVLNGDFVKIATEEKLKLVEKKKATRQSYSMVSDLTELQVGEVSEALMEPRYAQAGSPAKYVVAKVNKREEPDYSKLTKEMRETTKRRLQYMKQYEFRNIWIKDVAKKSNLKTIAPRQ